MSKRAGAGNVPGITDPQLLRPRVLKNLIELTVNEQLTRRLGAFEIPEIEDADENLSWDEVRQLVEEHRWTPPPGAKSSLELLREDRDR